MTKTLHTMAKKARHQEGQQPITHGMVAAIMTTDLAVADHIVDVDVGPVPEAEATQTEAGNVGEVVGAMLDLRKATDR